MEVFKQNFRGKFYESDIEAKKYEKKKFSVEI